MLDCSEEIENGKSFRPDEQDNESLLLRTRT